MKIELKRIEVALFLAVLLGFTIIGVIDQFIKEAVQVPRARRSLALADGTISLFVTPISATLGQSITFSGTVTPPLAQYDHIVLYFSTGPDCSNPLEWEDTVADGSGNYVYTGCSGLPAGSYSVEASDGNYASPPFSSCVDFTVGAAPPTQVQPLYGASWPSSEILVFIKPVGQVSGQASVSGGYARQAILDAMNTWNLAQKWFISTYMAGKGTPYTFKETNTAPTSGVVISFNQTQTSENWGWTNFYPWWYASGQIYRVSASISLILTWYNGSAITQSQLQAVTTRELGHALGLDHTTFSILDLMNQISAGYGVNLPSTLNLYAVYLLSKTNNIQSQPSSPVSLPPNIPYTETPQTALPEFNSTAPILLVVVLSFMGFSCRQISRRRNTTSTYPLTRNSLHHNYGSKSSNATTSLSASLNNFERISIPFHVRIHDATIRI